MPFVADVKGFDGTVMFFSARVTEFLGPGGQLLYWGINTDDSDHDSVDEMNFILPANGPFFFELKAPKV